jgi:hypothetical protein
MRGGGARGGGHIDIRELDGVGVVGFRVPVWDGRGGGCAGGSGGVFAAGGLVKGFWHRKWIGFWTLGLDSGLRLRRDGGDICCMGCGVYMAVNTVYFVV